MEAMGRHEIRKISYKKLHIACELNLRHLPSKEIKKLKKKKSGPQHLNIVLNLRCRKYQT
jgi:hypothetical protein